VRRDGGRRRRRRRSLRAGAVDGQHEGDRPRAALQRLHRRQLHHQEEGSPPGRCRLWRPCRSLPSCPSRTIDRGTWSRPVFWSKEMSTLVGLECFLNSDEVLMACAGVGGYSYLMEPLWWVGMITSKVSSCNSSRELGMMLRD
jgi:hypothetical protein